jgi:hypothetical protein
MVGELGGDRRLGGLWGWQSFDSGVYSSNETPLEYIHVYSLKLSASKLESNGHTKQYRVRIILVVVVAKIHGMQPRFCRSGLDTPYP